MRRHDPTTGTKTKGVYSAVARIREHKGEENSSQASRVQRPSRYPKFLTHFTKSFAKASKKIKEAVRGTPSEEPKVLATRSKWKAAAVCLVHIIPVLASTVLVALNLKGYFIGADLIGNPDQSSQAIYILCLQITAKLVEILTVTSLGVIVLDALRYFLIFDEQGLPLGLAGTNMQFSNVMFLASPAFWSGIRGLKTWRRRIPIMLLIIACCLLATFIGPSSALLLIPVTRTNWPAGGTQLWLNGNASLLWPETLDLSSVGGQECSSPSPNTIYLESLNNSGCIWYWTPSLTQYAKDSHFQVSTYNVSVFDGFAEREVQRRVSGDTWALSSMAHIARLSWAIGLRWLNSIHYASQRWGPLGQYSRLLFRKRTGTVSRIHSAIPAVRTKCNALVQANFSDLNVVVPYPILPPYTSGQLVDNNYGILPKFYPNSSVITTRWLTKPTEPNLSYNDSYIDYYPSAFLTIQIPHPNSTTEGTAFTCSVDARWTQGNNVGTNVQSVTDNFRQHGEVDSNAAMFAWTDMLLPVDDGSWQTVDLDLSWLEVLTPTLNSSFNSTRVSADVPFSANLGLPGWTTLSALFQQAGYDNSTGNVNNFGDLGWFTEEIIALLVADGMSRVGFTQNGGTVGQIGAFDDNYFDWLSSWSSMVLALLSNGSAISPPDPVRGPTISLQWTVTIEGYSYLADSTAYYLALTVVFVYMTLALSHVVYTSRKRWYSDIWDTVLEMVALCKNSPPSGLLENTSTGIEAHATNRLTLKIRVPNIIADEPERVCIVVGPEGREPRYHKVEIGKKYA